MIPRDTEKEIFLFVKQFKVAAIVSPMKSGQTITPSYFKGIEYWQKLTKVTQGNRGFVVYAGSTIQHRSQDISVLPYHNMGELIELTTS